MHWREICAAIIVTVFTTLKQLRTQKRHAMKIKTIFPAAVALLLLAACSSTRIVNTWRDPSVTVNTAKINKFLVAALLRNETVRRQVEDQMASEVPGKAVQSYKEFGLKELKESDDNYNAKLKADGFDGIVMMRIASIDSSTRFVQGGYPEYPWYYGGWRRFWGVSWTGYYEPSYYTTDKIYNIEITVYSLKNDKLIWSAISTAVNPSHDSKAFKNIAREVYRKMKQEKFLQ